MRNCAQKLDVQVKQQRVNDENSALFRLDPTMISNTFLETSTFLETTTFMLMSAKKKMSTAKKRLIPMQSRRALTPLLQNSVMNDTQFSELPELERTVLSNNDDSIFMRSGNFSQINITFNESKVKESVEKLLHSYNRRLIWNCLQHILTDCKTDVSKICVNTDDNIQ